MRDALHAWAVAGTGLAAAKVIWSDQGDAATRPATRPAPPYVSMKLIVSDQTRGMDWIDVKNAPAPADGAEIQHTARGPRTATLSVQCFGLAATAADGAGGSSPHALLARMKARQRLPTVRDALKAANIGVGTTTGVSDASAVINSATSEPRAVFTATIHYVSEESETGTYIEQAELEGTYEA